jgi:hypothetical protein
MFCKGLITRAIRGIPAIAMAATLLWTVSVSAYAQMLEIAYPAGGEVLTSGDTVRLEWKAGVSSAYCDLRLWNGATSTWIVIASSIDVAAESATWIVPDSLFGKLLRIGAFDTDGALVGVSGTYFVVAPYAGLSKPSGQEPKRKIDATSPELR